MFAFLAPVDAGSRGGGAPRAISTADLPADGSRRRCGCSVWIFRGNESRRRRGCDVDIPWSRGGAAAATRIFRGAESRRRRGRDVEMASSMIFAALECWRHPLEGQSKARTKRSALRAVRATTAKPRGIGSTGGGVLRVAGLHDQRIGAGRSINVSQRGGERLPRTRARRKTERCRYQELVDVEQREPSRAGPEDEGRVVQGDALRELIILTAEDRGPANQRQEPVRRVVARDGAPRRRRGVELVLVQEELVDAEVTMPLEPVAKTKACGPAGYVLRHEGDPEAKISDRKRPRRRLDVDGPAGAADRDRDAFRRQVEAVGHAAREDFAARRGDGFEGGRVCGPASPLGSRRGSRRRPDGPRRGLAATPGLRMRVIATPGDVATPRKRTVERTSSALVRHSQASRPNAQEPPCQRSPPR